MNTSTHEREKGGVREKVREGVSFFMMRYRIDRTYKLAETEKMTFIFNF